MTMNRNVQRAVDLLIDHMGDNVEPIELFEITFEGRIQQSLLGAPITNGRSILDDFLASHAGLSIYLDDVFELGKTPSENVSLAPASAVKASNGQTTDLPFDKTIKRYNPVASPIGVSVVRNYPTDFSKDNKRAYQQNPLDAPYGSYPSPSGMYWDYKTWRNENPFGTSTIILPGSKASYSADRLPGEYPEAEKWIAQQFPGADFTLGYKCWVGELGSFRQDSEGGVRKDVPKNVSLPHVLGYHVVHLDVRYGAGSSAGAFTTVEFYVEGAGPDRYFLIWPGIMGGLNPTGKMAYAPGGHQFGTFENNRSKYALVDGNGSGGDALNIRLRVIGSHPTLNASFQNAREISNVSDTFEYRGTVVAVTTLTLLSDVVLGTLSKDWYVIYHETGLGIWQPREAAKRQQNLATWSLVNDVQFRVESIDCAGNSVKNLTVYKKYAKARAKACKTNDFLEKPYDEYDSWGTINEQMELLTSNAIWFSRDWGTHLVFTSPDPRKQVAAKLVKTSDGKVSGVTITRNSESQTFPATESGYDAALDFLDGDYMPTAVQSEYLTAIGGESAVAELAEYVGAGAEYLGPTESTLYDLAAVSSKMASIRRFVNDQSDVMTMVLAHQLGEFSTLAKGLPKLMNSFSYYRILQATHKTA